MIKSITSIVKYEKLKLENHFYEMLTATVSHDMRTPINAISGLIHNLENHIADSNGKRFLEIIQYST